jgi:hypothetical protein
MKRVLYLKHVIEDQGGHRLFYVNGQPIKREVDLHVMFRLTWFDNHTDLDMNAEVNNGRGSVDFKVSKGKKNASLVEFKLAKNTALEKGSSRKSVGNFEANWVPRQREILSLTGCGKLA